MVEYGLNTPGTNLGVVGLGHLAVKFGKAFGMKVTVISTSPGKREEALDRLGADGFLVSRDPEQMKAAMATTDGIIDTVSARHQLVPLLELLKPRGHMVVVGAPSEPLELPTLAIIAGGKRVVGSGGGGGADYQAMLDFAADHSITADVEVVAMDYVNTAIERLEKNDVAAWASLLNYDCLICGGVGRCIWLYR
jgi:D-arabinose 1-dehydrogenase-like Zn-dependent alcohol dehydrogenase